MAPDDEAPSGRGNAAPTRTSVVPGDMLSGLSRTGSDRSQTRTAVIASKAKHFLRPSAPSGRAVLDAGADLQRVEEPFDAPAKLVPAQHSAGVVEVGLALGGQQHPVQRFVPLPLPRRRQAAGLVPSSDKTTNMLVDAVPLAGSRRDRAFFRKVQMVFQDPYASLHPRHTMDRMLSETIHLHGMGDIDRRIGSVLDDVGLPRRFRFRHPHQLSGGQRQRAAIARALAGKPDILLLDEPTSALDVSVQAEILNLLADLRREYGLTYLMVSHDLPVIAHMCERLAVMNQGEIVEVMDTRTLRSGRPSHPYSRALLNASSAP